MWLGRLDSNQYLRGNNPVGCQLTLHPKKIAPRHRREYPIRNAGKGSRDEVMGLLAQHCENDRGCRCRCGSEEPSTEVVGIKQVRGELS